MAFSFFTLFLHCVNYFYITQASWRVGGGIVLPHLTSGLVVSGTDIKLCIRYSSRGPSTFHMSANVSLIQLLKVGKKSSHGRSKNYLGLGDRGSQEVYSLQLSVILLSP